VLVVVVVVVVVIAAAAAVVVVRVFFVLAVAVLGAELLELVVVVDPLFAFGVPAVFVTLFVDLALFAVVFVSADDASLVVANVA
jgi:hypothetical protein